MMDKKNTKRRVNKANVVIAVILLALIGFLFGADAFNWLDDTSLRIVIGMTIVLVIVISVWSMNRKSR